MTKIPPKYRIVEVSRPPGTKVRASVLIIYTGGTVGMVHGPSGALVPLNFNEIVKRVPSLKSLDIRITVISFPEPFDSSNVTISEWQQLAHIIYENHHIYDGFVILHGTDTMSFTA